MKRSKNGSSLFIQKSDIEEFFSRSSGNRIFRKALVQAVDGKALLKILVRFVYFNSVFGGGVANLAGEIAVRQQLFRDKAEEIYAVGDRSVQIASAVFFAAIDEFGDTSSASRFTHRALAQATLKGMVQYYGCSVGEADELVRPNVAVEEAITRVKQGYLLNQVVDERKIFRGLGFHMGSEIFADEEFNILNTLLNKKYSELVAHLRRERVSVSDSVHPAYAWIHIHTMVEMDHFQFATLGANRALRYYSGPLKGAELKDLVIDGFKEFAEVQTFFMEHIAD